MSRNTSYFELPEYTGILTFVDAIFAELNMGLLIYHVEEPRVIDSFRLVYANRQASTFTGTDLRGLIGKFIFDAFPPLRETAVPQLFLEVSTTKEPRQLPGLDYADDNVVRGNYTVKAFPMPYDCVGVLFENLSRPEPS